MSILLILLAILAAVLLLAWLGLKVQPAALPAYAPQQPDLQTAPLPSGLPAPVDDTTALLITPFGEKTETLSRFTII